MLPLDAPTYLALPPPISTNALFNNNARADGRRGRTITPEYSKWRKSAGTWLMCQRPLPRFVGPVEIVLFVGEVSVGNMDIDNTKKAFLDVLVKHEIIKDDSRKWLRSIEGIWTPGLRGCVALIRPADEPPRVVDVLRHLKAAGRELVA